MSRGWVRRARRALWVVLAVLALAEALVRGVGLVDVPTYAHDDEVGYWVQPSQQGSFLWRNDWAFNDLSMPIGRDWSPDQGLDLVVIGNSIVMGGNPYRQVEKVPSLLQADLGAQVSVWPVATGGWSAVNQVAYLRRHPQVLAHADVVVWQFMSGAMGGLSQWRGPLVFPDRSPVWATGYVVQRYVLPRLWPQALSELPPVDAAQSDHVQSVWDQLQGLTQRQHPVPGVFFLYPTLSQWQQAQLGQEWMSERPLIQSWATQMNWPVLDMARCRGWNATMYRPDGVHPTPEGNRVIASCLSHALRPALASLPKGIRTDDAQRLLAN